MSQTLTPEEITRTRELCFRDPIKACAIAQEIINTCQVVSLSTYASLSGVSVRSAQYNAKNFNGIVIESRKFVSLNS